MQTKCCTKCGEEKPLEDFRKQKTGKFGRRADCKVCSGILNKQWREANPEKQREYSSKHYENNREKKLLQGKKWLKANPEKARKSSNKWRNQNKEKAASSVRRYQADRLNRTPDWLNKAHHVEMEAMYLYNQIMPGDWHVDHIDPLRGETVSGLHVPWNLQVITAKENLAKSNLLLDEAA